MFKYYILERNTFETFTLKSPSKLFSQEVLECEELGQEPFRYNTIEEAEKVQEALNVIFKGKSKFVDYIIVEKK